MTTASSAPPPAPATDGDRARARRRTNLLAGGLAVGTLAILSWWVLDRITAVHVTDARIAATMITISARTEGWIDTLAVEEGQLIEVGELLLAIDDREARLLLAEREAQLEHLRARADALRERRAMIDAQTASRLESRRSGLAAVRAALRAAESEHERALADWERAGPMLEREIISRQRWEALRNDYLQARSRLESASADLDSASSALLEAEADRAELRLLAAELQALEHQIDEARAQRDRQAVVVEDHHVRSPGRGFIDEIFVEPGEHVSRGRRLLMLHDPTDIWISANVKETELRHFATGAPARIRVDAYPRERLTGTVTRVGTAATSEFALLPTPNPSGNFTKITQRVKIRIDLDEQPQQLLRPGMMVEVAIER